MIWALMFSGGNSSNSQKAKLNVCVFAEVAVPFQFDKDFNSFSKEGGQLIKSSKTDFFVRFSSSFFPPFSYVLAK